MNPMYGSNYGVPTTGMAPNYSNNGYQQMTSTQQYEQQTQAQMAAKLKELETPTITTGTGIKFSVVGEAPKIPVNNDVSNAEVAEVVAKKKGRPRKTESSEIIRADGSSVSEKVSGTVEDTPTSYTYMETTGMLRQTLGEIDSLNAELMQEFEMVRHSRTMKNKYNTLVGLSENVGTLIGAKIQTIKEINNSISKSNDLDYKKAKDLKAANAAVDDDKYIADFYKSMMANPLNQAPAPQMPQVDPAIFGAGIVRADIRSGDVTGNGPVDAGYLNYLSNLSPEQNLMRYENDPNVKQVVVFDEATGNKFFQVMNLQTGQVVPNVPVYDQMFMEDTSIDLKTKTAKNINLNEVYPVVVINEGVKSQY